MARQHPTYCKHGRMIDVGFLEGLDREPCPQCDGADTRPFIVMLSTWPSQGEISTTEAFGPFEGEQEARDAAALFIHDRRYCSIHEIKPLPTGDSDRG